jgi:hypothetical protein
MISHALTWVDRGFAVFPLKPRDKIPLGSLAPHGLKDASRDPAVIRDWWRRGPQANIGIVTGGGRFVVDLDGADATHAWANMCGRHGEPMCTLTVRTARGWHLFFASPLEIPNSASMLGPKIDVRGEGGYVVGAPSIHPDGPVYTIRRDLPIAEAPRWLVDLAIPDERPPLIVFTNPNPTRRRADKAGLHGLPSILALVCNAPEGNRNGLTFWAACKCGELVAEGLIGPQEAGALLVEAARRSGLSAREATTTVLSAFRRARARR